MQENEQLPAAADQWPAVVYIGHRGVGGCLIEVVRNGQRPGAALKHQVLHSPTGLEWGYGGSGPADTARSILADYLGYIPSPAVYQRFKFHTIGGLPPSFALTSDEIDLSLALVKADLGVTCLRCRDTGWIQDWQDQAPASGKEADWPLDRLFCQCDQGKSERASFEQCTKATAAEGG